MKTSSHHLTNRSFDPRVRNQQNTVVNRWRTEVFNSRKLWKMNPGAWRAPRVLLRIENIGHCIIHLTDYRTDQELGKLDSGEWRYIFVSSLGAHTKGSPSQLNIRLVQH